jgi:cellulose synthase/poly-beta-1,6-N-acetylglucosamine synthase-like glycosyltransferase
MITAALVLFIAPLLMVTLVFSIEVAAGLVPLQTRDPSAASSPDVVVVVPAHDEAAIIGEAMRKLRAAAGDTMRILVIADNCSDSTAARARAEGVAVIERTDVSRRGKGYALAFAVEQLESAPPDVLVVLDADCSVDGPSLRRIAASAAERGCPCQAVNLLRADRKASPLVQISGFAFMLKNLVRQRGLQRLSGRVHLTGTGMAIPFSLLSSSLLATGDIVEDLSLGLELANRGSSPQLVPGALVLSDAASASSTLIQRRRWEGGFIATALRRAPRILVDAIRRGDASLLFGALDLMVPPLALLIFADLLAVTVLFALAAAAHISAIPLLLMLVGLAIAGSLVVAVWAREGRKFVSLPVLARVPFYIAWKLPLYLSLARRGAPREWLRTRR